MAERDLYAILGVPRTADQEQIRRAYRTLARTHHPDVNHDPAAEDRFKEIAAAYAVLSDPETRARYDAFGPDFRHVRPDVDPRARPAGGAGRRTRARSRRSANATSEGIDLDAILEELFGGSWAETPGSDQRADLPVTVEEAYNGARRTLTIGDRTVEVSIPAGVQDGQQLRLSGEGGRGGPDALAGDLYLTIRIQPHRRYRVSGRDLEVDLPLAPWEATLGTSVAVDTPGGEAKVTVPGGTSSGRRLRLRGRGLPSPGGTAGDLYARTRVVVPSRLSDTERALWQQLAAASDFDPRRSR
jgi:curved DNA-binding protein